MKVCALVPAFNENRTIAAVVQGAAGHVAQVLVVDDGSTDGTGETAAAAGADVLRLERNGGKGTAVRAGLSRIFQGDATHVLFMDGDLQHRPEEIPCLLAEAAATGAAMVIGERVFVRHEMPPSRYWANVIGSWALATLMGVTLKDTQSGFRLVRADVLKQLSLEAVGYEFETELVVKLARRGARIAGVPIKAVYGGEKSKLRPIRDTSRNVILALVYRFRRHDVGAPR